MQRRATASKPSWVRETKGNLVVSLKVVEVWRAPGGVLGEI